MSTITYSLADASTHKALAAELTQFVRENHLAGQVNGKEYVNVEGWQFAGSRLGIVPIVESCVDVSTADEIKYVATVRLLDLRTNQTVGGGAMLCSNKENGKKFYAEYAIASMAQTRAIGKAYRNVIAFLMRLAGFNPTPLEEMDFETKTTPQVPAPAPAPVVIDPAQVEAYTQQLHGAETLADLQRIWGTIPGLYQHQVVDVKETCKQALTPRTTVEYDPEQESTVPVMGRDEPLPTATREQSEEIIRLLNNPVIYRSEKTKMLLNINKLSQQRAAQSIDKLKQTIAEREQQQRVAA